MFRVTPSQADPELVRLAMQKALQHEGYSSVAYLDADVIDDYTLMHDDKGMFKGMEGTRLPRTNRGNTGGFHDRLRDPLGVLYEYGTEHEEWLKETDEDE
jgi:hypothetical protein